MDDVKKVILNGEVLIDLTNDTALEEDVLEGKTFHLATGQQAVGTLIKGIDPIVLVEIENQLKDI